MKKKILITLIWAFYFTITFILARMYIADFYYKKSQKLILRGYSEVSTSYINKAVSFNPYEPNYYRGRAKVNLVKLIYSDDPKPLKEEILKDLKTAYLINEDNLVTIRNLFPLYYFLSVKDINLVAGKENIDIEYVDIAKKFFEDNKHRFWGDAGVIVEVANYEKKLGFTDEYNESVERIRLLRPDLLDWHKSFR